MALEIDVSDPKKLTKNEILYLQDRDKLPEGVEPIAQEDREGGETVLVATAGGSATVPKDKLSEFTGHETPPDEGDADTEYESYEDLSDEDLKAECEGRDLATTGKRETLIKRLEADDAKG